MDIDPEQFRETQARMREGGQKELEELEELWSGDDATSLMATSMIDSLKPLVEIVGNFDTDQIGDVDATIFQLFVHQYVAIMKVIDMLRGLGMVRQP